MIDFFLYLIITLYLLIGIKGISRTIRAYKNNESVKDTILFWLGIYFVVVTITVVLVTVLIVIMSMITATL